MTTEQRGSDTLGHWRNLSITYDEALTRLPEALKSEGFGIITEVDIQGTFKSKLGVDFRRYRIFGACNPAFAHTALTKDPRVGVLLPCNVVLYETDDAKAVLGVVDPMQTIGSSSGVPEFAELAQDVKVRLDRFMSQFPV